MIFTASGERYMVSNGGTLLRWHVWPNGVGVWVRAQLYRAITGRL